MVCQNVATLHARNVNETRERRGRGKASVAPQVLRQMTKVADLNDRFYEGACPVPLEFSCSVVQWTVCS